MNKNTHEHDNKTGIKEDDTLFDGNHMDNDLKASFKDKLSDVRTDAKISDLLILPREKQGEDWLKELGIIPQPNHLVAGGDPEFPDISIMIFETNVPEVFLKIQTSLRNGQTTIDKSLIIQKEKPISINFLFI